MTTADPGAIGSQLQAWIADTLGLHFGPDKHDWLAELATRRSAATGIRSPAEYLARLAMAGDFLARERDQLLDQLTVGETFFYRNHDQFRAWTEGFLPARLPTISDVSPLRVLSAGCASGEEPYTVAIFLREILPYLPAAQVAIHAVDINPAALERARQGRYSAWALRQTPAAAVAANFRPAGVSFKLRDEVCRMVQFREMNLADPHASLWREPAFDVVFCRNVLMYFTPEAMRGAVERLTSILKPGGILFLGHAETLRGLSHDYHLCNTHGTFYYQRKAPGEPSQIVDSTPVPVAYRPQEPAPAPLVGGWPDAINSATERIRSLHTAKENKERNAGPTQDAGTRSGSAVQRAQTTAKVMDLLQQERFAEALAAHSTAVAEPTAGADDLMLHAVLLVHAGRLDEGRSACARLLAVDDLNAGAHYLMALCHEQQGELTEAIRHNQAALYLDPTFSIPQLHLGLIARRSGDIAGAQRALQQAQLLLAREDISRILLFGGGFSREALAALCTAELLRLGGVA